MTLAPERARMTTASQAPLIIHGGAGELYDLWLTRTGQAPPEDFTNNFPVQWGKFNEPFVLDWVERTTKAEITERQRWITHPTLPDIGATLDGYRPRDDAVIECKVLSPFTRATDVGNTIGFVNYYAPQVVVQMACRQAANGFLVVQQGNSEPQQYPINVDAAYTNAILARLAAFQICVETRSPPSAPPPAPVPPERWRQVDLDADQLSNWGHAMKPRLDDWQATRTHWNAHESAKKDVKVLLPDDVGRVTYGPITVRRSRNGAVTIMEEA